MSRRPRIPSRVFSGLVARALDDLPEEFASLLENVVVVVEDEPSVEDLAAVGIDGDHPESDELLGLYQGVPQTEMDSFLVPGLPDRVVLFRGPLERSCSNYEEVVDEVRKTVLHELGHYFGMEEDQMPY